MKQGVITGAYKHVNIEVAVCTIFQTTFVLRTMKFPKELA